DPCPEPGADRRAPNPGATWRVRNRLEDFAVDVARGITLRALADGDLEVSQDRQRVRSLDASLKIRHLCQVAFVHRAPCKTLLQGSEPDRERCGERTKRLRPGWQRQIKQAADRADFEQAHAARQSFGLNLELFINSKGRFDLS